MPASMDYLIMFIIKEKKTMRKKKIADLQISVFMIITAFTLSSQNKYVESAFKCLVFPFSH